MASGVCELNEAKELVGITERTKIEKRDGGIAFSEDDGETWTTIDGDTLVSMNMWGFTRSILDEIKAGFPAFLDKGIKENPMKCEYFLPSVVSDLLAEGRATVRVLESEDKWYTEIGQVLDSAKVNGAILSQTLSGDSALQQKADEYGISLGKATLIQSLVDSSNHLTFESLVGLSINELNLLANSTAVQTPDSAGGQTSTTASNPALNSVGTASQSAYIGVEAAKEAALTHAGVTSGDVVFLEADYDYEDGRMVYEVEFFAGNTEYEYDVDASTGAIVKHGREQKGGSLTSGGSTAQTDIGEAAAKAAAFAHAGVAEGDVRGLTVKRDFDDGRLTYELEFWAGTTEYEYEIAAADGSVLKSKREEHPNALPADQAIGRDAARDAALAHAGVALTDTYELE